MANKITQHRRGTYDEWLELNLVPYDGELIIVEFENNVCKCKIGDGETTFSDLPYITDWVVDEFVDKLGTLYTLTGADLDKAKAEIYQKIEEALTVVNNDIIKLETDVNNLANNVESLSDDLNKVDSVVKTLVEPAVGSLDAKYSEELARITDKHANDVLALNTNLERKTAELKTYTEASVSNVTSKLTNTLANTKTDITADYTYKIIEAEDRLRAAVTTTDQTVQQQATAITKLQSDVEVLTSSIDEKIAASDTTTNSTISEIIEDLQQINLAIEQLQNKNSSTSATTSSNSNTASTTGSKTDLAAIVAKLEDLQFKVEMLNTNASTTTAEVQSIKTELSRLTTKVANLITQQATNNSNLINELRTLGAELRKADADTNLAITENITEVNKELSKLSAADTVLYQTVYKIQDELIKKIDSAEVSLQANHAKDFSAINQSVSDFSTNLSSQLNKTKTELANSITTAKADLNKRIDNLDKLYDNRTDSNEIAIAALKATTSTGLTRLENKFDALEGDVVTSKANLTSTRETISQLNSTLDNKVNLINSNLDSLSARVDTKLAAAENRLQLQADSLEQQVQKQEKMLQSVQETVSGLNTELDKKVTEKVNTTTYDINNSISSIREDINRINLTLEQLENTAGSELNNDNLLIFIEQLSALQYKVDALESDTTESSAEIQQLAIELSCLSTSLSGLMEQQKANNDSLSNMISALNTSLSKADSKITETMLENLTDIRKELSELADDDLVLYAIMYQIHDKLVNKINQIQASLQDDISTKISVVNDSIAELDNSLNTGISDLQKTFAENIDVATQNLTKEISMLRGQHSTLITVNKNNIIDLCATVKDNYTKLTNTIEQANTDIAANKLGIATNTEAIRQADIAFDNNVKAINADIKNLDTQIEAQAKRISSLIALPVGSTTEDGELQDIRNGYNATRYDSAGDAVRAVGNEVQALKNSLSQYIGTQAINGLRYDTEGTVGLGQPYMLYLTANGEILQDSGVQIISGAGGGGGGSASSELKISYITKDAIKITSPEEAVLSFLFSGVDSSGDTLSQASAQWKVDGITVARDTVNNGENTFDASAYVKENGTIKVLLIVTDDNGSVVTKTWSIQHIELTITSNFNDKKSQRVGEDIIFTYIPEGAIKKTAVFKLNGAVIGRQTLEADASNREISYPIPAYDENGELRGHGSYLLEVYLEAEINGETVPSKSHVIKDLIWYDSEERDPVIGAAPHTIKTKQYATTDIVYTVYDPANINNPRVVIEVDGTPVSYRTIESNNDYNNTPTDVYSYTTDKVGTHTIKIICGKTEKVITVVVDSLNIDVSPVTTGLVFDFHPVGVSNSDLDKRLWSYNDIHMAVSDNFDWKNGGYLPDDPDGPCFCIKAGSTATIDYKLFANDAKSFGKEFKLIFKTKHVANPDAVFLSCLDNKTAQDHIGIQMGVHKANIYGQSGNLELAYSEEDIIEFEFNISKNTEAVPMVMGYEDGVPSRPMVYDSTYSFKQDAATAKEITLGSPDCDLYIYRFKVYNRSLTAAEILDNFIADARTSEEMLSRYNRNQIYNENNKLDPDVLAQKCPWLRVYKLSAPRFTKNKSDKVKNTTIQQLYKDGDPVLDNWTCHNAQHSGQGTSSNNYGAAGRNLDFIMNKDGAYFELGDGTTASTITLTRESVPVAYLNAKVNIASSNNLTNALLANRYNRFNPYRRPFVERDGVDTDFIKDTMEFHNCVIFIQETDSDLSTHREFADTNWHFYAIGNIGDSKKTDSTRATDPDDKYECCVEIMDVGLPLSDFPADTMINAMGYSVDEKDSTIKHYTWAKDENLGILYERRFTKTTDETVDLSKDYYVEVDGKMTLAKSHYVEIKEYLWATDDNLGILFEKVGDEYVLTADTAVDYDKVYYIKEEVKDELDNIVEVKYLDAMGYTIKTVKTNDWVTNENIDNLYELEYFLTEDTTVNYNKIYYIDILEHDDFSEDYTYGWRYLWEDGSDEENEEVFNYCKQKWIEFYRFVTASSDEYFKEHFEDYFVKDSALYYYLFTTRYCMVDNRAKNTFWHYGKTGGIYESDIEIKNTNGDVLFSATAGEPIRKWDLCWDYDNDTSLGLNNFGKQVYRYGLEDIDRDDANMEIFRESDSTFFCRVRDLFAAELQDMYQDLESKNAWHAESFIKECDTWQEEFPEELWHIDIDRKYIRTYNSSGINGKGDEQFLVNMCNGKMKYHRRQWERSQEAYMASKYKTPVSLGDSYHANFRVNRFESTEGMTIVPNYQFTLTPYSYIYLNVQYGGTKPISIRAVPNVATVVPFSGALSADIINVGSAAAIRDFGNLSALYPYTVSMQNATRVKTLTLGTATEGYSNVKFDSLDTGDNALLEELTLTNITGYTGSLDLSELLNLKKFYAFGTNLTSILFADGGKLDYAELPAVNNITLKNLIYLSSDNLKLIDDNYDNVIDLTVENCPLIDKLALLDKCKNLTRARLIGIDFGTKTYEYFQTKLFHLKGLNSNNDETPYAQIDGKVRFDSITGAEYAELKSYYPDLTIDFGEMTSNVTFSYTDANGIEHEENRSLTSVDSELGDVSDFVPEQTPAWPENDAFTYELVGWSRKQQTSNGIADSEADYLKYLEEDALIGIAGDRVLYPVFKAVRKQYEVKFINNNEVLYSVMVPYGSDAIYVGDEPVKSGIPDQNLYEFVGWNPTPDNITESKECVAQFVVLDSSWYTLTLIDIADGYTLDTNNNTMSITKYNDTLNGAIKVPESFEVDNKIYSVTSLAAAFYACDSLVLVSLPSSLREIQAAAFYSCDNLTEITLPNGIKEISTDAFARCSKLEHVKLPSSLTTLNATCFSWCSKLSHIDLPEGLKIIYTYVFNECALETVNIPKTVSDIKNFAFGQMNTLKTVTFEKCLNEDGSVKIPEITEEAFISSGSEEGLTFNLPWTRKDHYDKYNNEYKEFGEDFVWAAKKANLVINYSNCTVKFDETGETKEVILNDV